MTSLQELTLMHFADRADEPDLSPLKNLTVIAPPADCPLHLWPLFKSDCAAQLAFQFATLQKDFLVPGFLGQQSCNQRCHLS